jgi:hypothetical protein
MILEIVKPEEPISRFILDKAHYRSDMTVKHNAFMPPKGKTEVSVYRIKGLATTEIWQIGDDFVAQPRCQILLGRADLHAEHAYSQGLDVKPDIQPHPRHANICGFPANESEKVRMLALELAACASFCPRNSS